MVKAFLVAAYPQNIALRRRVGLARHNTPTGLEAIIAPQSVNAPPKARASSSAAGPRTGDERQPSWWSYGMMHISNRQGFLRSTTLIDPYHVALFGGLTAHVDDDARLREIDGWIELRGSRATLRLLAQLRDFVARSVDLRALEPRATLPQGVQSALREVCAVLVTGVPRQERIVGALPENLATSIEKPPEVQRPPPGWEGRTRASREEAWKEGDAAWDAWQEDRWDQNNRARWDERWDDDGRPQGRGKGKAKGKGKNKGKKRGKGKSGSESDQHWADSDNAWETNRDHWKDAPWDESGWSDVSWRSVESSSRKVWQPVKPKSTLSANAATFQPGAESAYHG